MLQLLVPPPPTRQGSTTTRLPLMLLLLMLLLTLLLVTASAAAATDAAAGTSGVAATTTILGSHHKTCSADQQLSFRLRCWAHGRRWPTGATVPLPTPTGRLLLFRLTGTASRHYCLSAGPTILIPAGSALAVEGAGVGVFDFRLLLIPSCKVQFSPAPTARSPSGLPAVGAELPPYSVTSLVCCVRIICRWSATTISRVGLV